MALTNETLELEAVRAANDVRGEIHLWREGTFLRAYDWSAWLCCRYLHDFKVTKRQFKDIDAPVAFIGFPETSLPKWLPEGSSQRVEGEKRLVLTLPEGMLGGDTPEAMAEACAQWKEALPLAETKERTRPARDDRQAEGGMSRQPPTLTAIMQRILAWPIESMPLTHTLNGSAFFFLQQRILRITRIVTNCFSLIPRILP